MDQIIKKLIGLFTIITIITSVMYLWAYWYTFGINAFEFIDISNIISHSIIPLLFSTGGFLYMIYHYFKKGYFFIPPNECGDRYPKYSSELKKSKRFKKGGIVFLIMTVILCVLANWFYFLWAYAPICIAFLVTGYLTLYKNFGKRFIPDPDIRFVLFFIIVFLPLVGAAYGKKKAETIKRGDKYLYIDGISISEEVRKRGDDKIRYIGTMSDYFFFLLPNDKSIYIASQEDIKPFVLQRYDRRKNKE